MSEEESPWPWGTQMCAVCGIRPAVVTGPDGEQVAMCNQDYEAYAASVEQSEVTP